MAVGTIEELECHIDARGFVMEPMNPDQMPAQRNIHVAVTEPGAVRGNHYHERGTEIMVIAGPALVRVREDVRTRDVFVPPGKVFRFTFQPYVSHAMQNTGDKPLLIIACNSEVFDRAKPDVVRDVLIE
jgi:dTDP-4-dehydrorhamnose 3,5-epimerase-like enzyme